MRLPCERQPPLLLQASGFNGLRNALPEPAIFDLEHPCSSATAKIMQGSSRHLAGFRSRLSGGGWLSPSCCGRFSRVGHCGLSRFGCGGFSRVGCGRFSRSGYDSFSRVGYGGFSRFAHGFNRSRQFRLGRFLRAMLAMVQRLDARSFFFRPQLSVCAVSALVLKVFRNRFSCHGRSVAELSPPELSNFAPLGDNS